MGRPTARPTVRLSARLAARAPTTPPARILVGLLFLATAAAAAANLARANQSAHHQQQQQQQQLQLHHHFNNLHSPSYNNNNNINQHLHQHHHHNQLQHQATARNGNGNNNSAAASECAASPNICQNGATCVNKPGGGYKCICVNGWDGPNCTENVDDCTTAACENGATCHDRIGHFVCVCPPAKTGLLCQLDDGCFNNPCHPNATCDTSPVDGRAICTCLSGFSGPDCSIDNDECAAGSPCEHGGWCVNMPGTFRCECPRGFAGPRCETNINECEENPCLNDGSCLDEKGGYKCICTQGYTGQRCEANIDDCAQNPCQNGATCKDEVNSFICLCPAGYWGARCEYNQTSSPKYNYQTDTVYAENPQLGTGNPWSKCYESYACWTKFNDAKCDHECNIAQCLYDGNDCKSFNAQRDRLTNTTPAECDQKLDLYCLKSYANGICDQECNNPECSWDGLDCESAQASGNVAIESATNAVLLSQQQQQQQQQQQPPPPPPPPAASISTQAQGLLVIRVEPMIEFGSDDLRTDLAKLLRSVSVRTGTVLKAQNYRNIGNATEIELIADNRKCQSYCYNSTDLIAKFLGALRNNTPNIDKILADKLIMTNIRSQLSTQNATDQTTSTPMWLIFCCILAAFCTLLMVVSIGNKPKKEKAINWFPEGFKPVLSSRNRADPTDRKNGSGQRGPVSTLQALGGNFFRGIKRNERNISTNPNGAGLGGGLNSTDIDRCTNTPNGGVIYHEPYDQYDQYGSTTYGGTDTGTVINTADAPMTPITMQLNPMNIEGPHGLTPLMVASMGQPLSKEPLGLVAYGTTGEIKGSSDNNVSELLQRGAQLNLANKVTGETALHLAARHGRVDAARVLLDRCDSQDVNAQDGTGRTPLHTAIAADSLGVFELLIRCRGTDLNAQMHDGTTPLILATRVGTYSMLEELILNECDVTKSDANGKTALHWAAATNNVDAIRRLLAVRETNKDAQDLNEETPLFLAAREGARGAVEILLQHNANKDISDHMDISPIEIADSRKHSDIVCLLEQHEPPTPRSITSVHHSSSRQISPFSPDSNSNSNGCHNQKQAPPVYHSQSQSNGGRNNCSQGGRQAQKAALARSNSTKPLIAEANIIRNNLQNHCRSTIGIKSEEKEIHDKVASSNNNNNNNSNNNSNSNSIREAKTLGRRATQSTSSSHQAIQPNMQHTNQFGSLSTNNVVMPATPNSLTNSLSPVSSSMMSPPTTHSLHHLNSPTKTMAPVNLNQMYRSQPINNQQISAPPPAYEECQLFWSNNNNNNPNMISVINNNNNNNNHNNNNNNNNNNNIIDKTQHGLSGVYNVPCLKNYMTPSPDSPFSLESMSSPPGAYNDQQYQNLSNQQQAGVFI